jgi:hypothetical protein
MMSLADELRAQVDAQLLEQGVFAPLELLLNGGRLAYADYESWRRGEIETLDAVLMGNPQKIREELDQAVRYARGIGLVEQPQEFHAWASDTGSPAERPLRISLDAKLRAYVGSRYLPAQAAPQMDLFFDNPVVALTTGLIRSLADRNGGEAQRLLDRLYTQAPTHPDLPAFDRLLVAVGRIGQAVEDAREAVDFLLALTPTAKRILGPQSRDLLSPLWQQIAVALAAHAFSPQEPELHRSFALLQAQDWAAVAASVHAEAGWPLQPILCVRLAQSAWQRRRRVEALGAWCQVCWRAPAQISEFLLKLPQPELNGLWQTFLDSEEDLGTGDRGANDLAAEPALTAAEFPVWLLLTEPGLAQQLAADLPTGSTAAEEHYRCVHRWIHARRANRPQDELALRKTLQAAHPVLFRMLKKCAEGTVAKGISGRN